MRITNHRIKWNFFEYIIDPVITVHKYIPEFKSLKVRSRMCFPGNIVSPTGLVTAFPVIPKTLILTKLSSGRTKLILTVPVLPS